MHNSNNPFTLEAIKQQIRAKVKRMVIQGSSFSKQLGDYTGLILKCRSTTFKTRIPAKIFLEPIFRKPWKHSDELNLGFGSSVADMMEEKRE